MNRQVAGMTMIVLFCAFVAAVMVGGPTHGQTGGKANCIWKKVESASQPCKGTDDFACPAGCKVSAYNPIECHDGTDYYNTTVYELQTGGNLLHDTPTYVLCSKIMQCQTLPVTRKKCETPGQLCMGGDITDTCHLCQAAIMSENAQATANVKDCPE